MPIPIECSIICFPSSSEAIVRLLPIFASPHTIRRMLKPLAWSESTFLKGLVGAIRTCTSRLLACLPSTSSRLSHLGNGLKDNYGHIGRVSGHLHGFCETVSLSELKASTSA
jgi:hypothetical protein